MSIGIRNDDLKSVESVSDSGVCVGISILNFTGRFGGGVLMKKILLLLFVFATVLSAMGQKESPSPERIILNDILSEIGKPEISTHIRILEKMGKFNLLPAESTVSDEEFKAFHKELKNTVFFIPSSGKPFLHNQVPSRLEMENDVFGMSLAKGQKTFSVFGVIPADELQDVKISVGELKGETGKVFPADAIKIYFLKHLMRSSDQYVFRPYPFGMQPLDAPISLHKGITYDFAVEANASESLSPDTYSGKVTFSCGKLSIEKKMSVKVYDFTLLRPEAERMNWGFYCSLKGTAAADYEFMASYGINTVVVYAEIGEDYLRKIQNIRKSGVDGILLLDVGALDSNIKDIPYTKEWEVKYKEQVAAFHKQMKAAGEDGRYIGLIHDEPRETMLNAWNRNYEQMMIYHRLVGEAAPGMPRGVNPMSDGPVSEQHPLGLYADFAKTFEMIMPHYWKYCKNMIRLAKENPKCSLWSYNDGDNRLAWGFHSWKVGLRGRTLYNYRPYTSDEHPLSPVYMSSREFDGRSFTGNYVVAWKDRIWSTVTLMNMYEGINDYKYVYTLEKMIGKASAEKKAVAAEAQAFLDKLKGEIPEYAHSEKFTDGKESGTGEVDAQIVTKLDSIRAKLADYIEKISK